jgi:hypothetical protein
VPTFCDGCGEEACYMNCIKCGRTPAVSKDWSDPEGIARFKSYYPDLKRNDGVGE